MSLKPSQNQLCVRLSQSLIGLLLWLLSVCAFAASSSIVYVDHATDFQRAKTHYLVDTTNRLSFDEVHGNTGLNWQPSPENVFNVRAGSHAVWYRFHLENREQAPINVMLELAFPMLDYVGFYRLNELGLAETILTGDLVPYSQRAVDHPNFIFPIALQQGERQTVYLRIQSASAHITPINVWLPQALVVHLSNEDSWHGGYLGGGLTIVLFYLSICLWLRERMYFYYCMSLVGGVLYISLLRGMLFPLFFSNSPEIVNALLMPTITVSLFFAALFMRDFMSLNTHSKGLDNLVLSMAIIMVLTAFASLFLGDTNTNKLLNLAVALTSFLSLMCGPLAIAKGCPNSWTYTIASFAYVTTAIIAIMSRYGLLPVSAISEYGTQVGMAIHHLIISTALLYRVYQEHQEKLAAQAAQLAESTERIKAEEDLLKISMTHPVTLLPNRTAFEQQAQKAIENRGSSRIGVVVIEISRYSEISKTLGHQNTDLLMSDLAGHYNLLLSKAPGIIQIEGPSFKSYLCSLENASFGVLLDADEAEQQEVAMKNLARALRKPIEFKGMLLELSVIAGIAICPEHGLSAEILMRHAGVALDSSEAKEFHVAYFKPEQDQYNARRLTMIADLKQAIKDDALELYLQPKFDPQENKVVGAEALLRWQHPRYGMIRPDEFIPIAEQTGIIKPLTRWVFSRALSLQKELIEKNYALSISVNVSAANLQESDLIPFLKAELESKGIDPQTVYLELTETSMMSDPQAAIDKLNQIQSMGLRISVDDFGAGYSSLAYLRNLPADEIKVDRALVMELDADNAKDTVIQSTIDMCHKLGFSVVAEGVETTQMLNTLTDLHCDLIQGYLLTPPLPYAQFVNWLEGNKSNRFAS